MHQLQIFDKAENACKGNDLLLPGANVIKISQQTTTIILT